ncbi:OmpH family outer membrane protein [Mucilaginibacter ximonensis]|uniref:OmpH family outer membrane protein n=1 Tax=Mucilaginibacter ximonensis TaxID=538021 RepID=A0ABW5YEV6_9SPHI
MKTTGSVITKITLGLAVAASVVACNNNKPAATPAAAPSATTTTSDKGTTVYINLDSLSSQYNYAKDVQERITSKAKASDAEEQSKGQAFERNVAEYKKNVATLPADKRQETEARLSREQSELQLFHQNAGIDLQKFQADETRKLYQKVFDFSKTYAKEKNYKLILTYSKSTLNAVYVDPSLDVTADIIKELNDDYAKNKK